VGAEEHVKAIIILRGGIGLIWDPYDVLVEQDIPGDHNLPPCRIKAAVSLGGFIISN
jgi:hypothetical protein